MKRVGDMEVLDNGLVRPARKNTYQKIDPTIIDVMDSDVRQLIGGVAGLIMALFLTPEETERLFVEALLLRGCSARCVRCRKWLRVKNGCQCGGLQM